MISRRDMMAGTAIFAMVAGVAPSVSAKQALTGPNMPSPHIALLLKTVSQIVIPASDTPGAGDVGVGAFVSLALAHGLEGTGESLLHPVAGWPMRSDGRLHYDLWLERELDHRAGGAFLTLPPAQQARIVAQLDAEAFPAGPPPANPSPWAAIKALILIGYYSSEAGASKELQYNLIPGRWDADLPLKPGDRAFSSDWTAVEFG